MNTERAIVELQNEVEELKSRMRHLEMFGPELFYTKMNNIQLEVQEHAAGVQRVYEEFRWMNIRLGRLAEAFGYYFDSANVLRRQQSECAEKETLLLAGDVE